MVRPKEYFDKEYDTEHIKKVVDTKDLVSLYDLMEEYAEQLNIAVVSQQRELLIAFHKWQQKMWTNPNYEITENVVDVYLKSNL